MPDVSFQLGYFTVSDTEHNNHTV